MHCGMMRPMGFHLHTANRLESLADVLAGLLRSAPDPDPLARTSITIAHPGMARWLEIRLAGALGVVMHHDWPLPGRSVWQLLRAAGESLPELDPMERPRLALRLWSGMRASRWPMPPHLAGDHDPDGLRSWRIALALADAFDQYPLYRPDWVRDWDAGRPGFGGKPELIEHYGWQARLWRQLTADTPHRLQCIDRLLQRLDGGERPPGLPARLLLFGLNHLPPLYLDLFVALGSACEVHAFVLTPSAEWWGDAPGRREARRRLLADDDTVHPLLAQWGRQARDFIGLIYDRLERVPHHTHEHFHQPAQTHTLARVQRHLQTLEPPASTFEADASLKIHASHSPMRACQEAVEAILAARRADPSLAPRDIAILCTDIDRYAPFLEAAFEALPAEARLPWVIVDRRADHSLPLLATVLELLRLPRRRFTVTWLRALLDEAAIRRRFDIDETLLPQLDEWLQRHGVCWGLDASDRERLEFTGHDRHSLAFGERRALAGYALAADDFSLFDDIAPANGVEGDLAAALGGVLELGERLQHWRRQLDGKHRLSTWCRMMAEMLGDLLDARASDLEQLEPLLSALSTLETDSELAAETTPGSPAVPGPALDPVLGPALFRALLDARLEVPRISQGYLGGGITCCALQPLRNLPFRHVQVLGLNEADFPRRDTRTVLNALSLHTRAGDRSPRDDDRLMLLETLLAARDALHLHCQHRDARDDAVRQPAAPLRELLDYLHGHEHAFETSPFVHIHPLQAFSPARYRGNEPACDPFWQATAQALLEQQERRPAMPLGDEPAPLPEGLEPVLSLEDLGRFLRGPLAWFMQRGLGIPPVNELPQPQEEERFEVDGLAGYAVRARLFQAFSEGRALPPERIAQRLRAEGLLPQGPAGEAGWREHSCQWQRIRQRLQDSWSETLDPLPLHLPFSHQARAFRLEGWLDGLHLREGVLRLLRVRLGTLRAGDRLALWVDLLAACALERPHGHTLDEARIFARDSDMRLRPLAAETAREQLTALCHLALEGLQRPLPLVPEAVWHFATAGAEAARETIEKEWNTPQEHRHQPSRAWRERQLIARVFGELETPFGIAGFETSNRALAAMLSQALPADQPEPVQDRPHA
ncbi:MAG TPA: exodeoxyribonuclease V subunit gamma [Gammaproteobacteria bacterium]|nr:exodeoxyribonuclease V subunit gamma [Gammaproteobacteria bacterium]